MLRFAVVALVVLAVSVSANPLVAFDHGVETSPVLLEASAKCFPDCKWHCDDPTCPAKCEPQCEKPQCELRCGKLSATNCDIRCEKPKCEVRCSRKNCAAGGCPLCENVCMPAKCQTVCTPATPSCRPACSAPKCTWSCKKPSSCPKPKCNLGCESKASHVNSCSGQAKCCSCNNGNNLASALEVASASHRAVHGDAHDDMFASMVEVAHELRHSERMETECCPCA